MKATDQGSLKLTNARTKYPKMTAGFVIQALQKRYPRGTQWVFLTEVAFGTGSSRGSDNHIDAMAFNCWPSMGLHRLAFEVKVSREDFKKELRDPEKRKNAVECSNQFYFAAPQGLIHASDLPPEAGLVEIDEKGESSITVQADHRTEPKFPYGFFIAALRCAQGVTINRQNAIREFRERMDRTLHDFPEWLFETEKEHLARIRKQEGW